MSVDIARNTVYDVKLEFPMKKAEDEEEEPERNYDALYDAENLRSLIVAHYQSH